MTLRYPHALATLCAIPAMLYANIHLAAFSEPTPSNAEGLRYAPLTRFSTGYPSFFADLLWIHTSIEGGGHEDFTPKALPLYESVHAITLLDPTFKEPYVFAGSVLAAYPSVLENVQAILRKGMQTLPKEWLVSFLYGFNSFYYQKNHAEAVVGLKQAALSNLAPPTVSLLATRLAIEAQVPHEMLDMVDAFERNTHDPKEKNLWHERKQQLLHEQNLLMLNTQLKKYHTQHAQPCPNLHTLQTQGFIDHIPQEPFGKTYYINPQGVAVSDSPRLHLYNTP
jgi:hypothetical protein